MFNLLMNWMRDNKILPQISDTERQALEAGDVWIDGQFFGGKVDFESILAENYDQLCEHEQAYIDGPVEELLKRADAYTLSRTRKLPDELFTFMAENGLKWVSSHSLPKPLALAPKLGVRLAIWQTLTCAEMPCRGLRCHKICAHGVQAAAIPRLPFSSEFHLRGVSPVESS